jgi:beta-glucosidase
MKTFLKAGCLIPSILMTVVVSINVTAQLNRAPALVDSSTDKMIMTIVAGMTLAEKIGQMTQAECTKVTSEEVTRYALGSLLSGGSSLPNALPKEIATMYAKFQKAALATRLKIPLIYGIDAVHGHNNVSGTTIFPHNIGLGATRDTALVKEICRIAALEVAATGLDWTFAPCIAVPQDERWGRTYEGFGENADLQAMFAPAAVTGFQQKQGAMKRIAACAKHFVGDGGTTYGTGTIFRKLIDRGDTRVDEAALRAVHLPGYCEAINAGVFTVMASYSSVNGLRMHGNKHLLTDVLKKELGFQGLLVSDWEAINDVVPNNYRASVKTAVNAGIDMAMDPKNWKRFIEVLTGLVDKDEVPVSRINDAVTRILRVKYAIGLMQKPIMDYNVFDTIGCAVHRAVARRAVQESCVLLKNDKSILPLAVSGKKIVVTGSHCDNAGLQCGGWTLTWGGVSGKVPGATSVLAGIRSVAVGDSIIYAPENTVVKGVDAAVIVVGEAPYAEMMGDKKADELTLDKKSRDLVERYHRAGIPVVTVLISGRPLVITHELEASHAFIAAWLPGSEGAGVADVLFGKAQLTGKLPHTWPSSAEQIPINAGDGKKPLFELGFGLRYQ